jgi:hypothetical protein
MGPAMNERLELIRPDSDSEMLLVATTNVSSRLLRLFLNVTRKLVES